ncbi:hypothetical protein [Cupriavidus sp. RAF12]|uniref:hypothetical protein n=1 Tax=Cupriavidus sp. RAF12 TaxID=3233050 RepID=UPI003F8FC245
MHLMDAWATPALSASRHIADNGFASARLEFQGAFNLVADNAFVRFVGFTSHCDNSIDSQRAAHQGSFLREQLAGARHGKTIG